MKSSLLSVILAASASASPLLDREASPLYKRTGATGCTADEESQIAAAFSDLRVLLTDARLTLNPDSNGPWRTNKG